MPYINANFSELRLTWENFEDGIKSGRLTNDDTLQSPGDHQTGGRGSREKGNVITRSQIITLEKNKEKK